MSDQTAKGAAWVESIRILHAENEGGCRGCRAVSIASYTMGSAMSESGLHPQTESMVGTNGERMNLNPISCVELILSLDSPTVGRLRLHA